MAILKLKMLDQDCLSEVAEDVTTSATATIKTRSLTEPSRTMRLMKFNLVVEVGVVAEVVEGD